MAAGIVSLPLTRCKRTCGNYRGILKVLMLLAMCGWTYYLSKCLPRGPMPDTAPLTAETFDVGICDETCRCEFEPKEYKMSEKEHEATVLPSRRDFNSHVFDDLIEKNDDQLVTAISPFGLDTCKSDVEPLKVNVDLYVNPKSSQPDVSPEIVEITLSSHEIVPTPQGFAYEVVEVTHGNVDFLGNSESTDGISTSAVGEMTESNCDLDISSCDFTPEVVQLTRENFDSLVSDSEPWLVEFYAPWCPHCKNFEDSYDNVASRLWPVINVGRVDGSKEQSLSKQYGVRSFPQFFFLLENQTWPYDGRRTEKDIEEFALNLLWNS